MSFHVLVGTLLRGHGPAAACTVVVCTVRALRPAPLPRRSPATLRNGQGNAYAPFAMSAATVPPLALVSAADSDARLAMTAACAQRKAGASSVSFVVVST
jgi:hypothetical protein